MEYTYIVMFKQSKVSGVQIKKSKICHSLAFSVFSRIFDSSYVLGCGRDFKLAD